jgi:glycosyltransferase involved in cell wall biosynthesis
MFWRELRELRRLGAHVDQVSTRAPAVEVQAHEWSAEAKAATWYLFPLGVAELLGALGRLIAAGPRAWGRAGVAVLRSERSLRERGPLLAAVLLGARLAQLSRSRGWDHLHVHSCASAADVARFARIFGACPYSLTLHGGLPDYGPDQRAKWGGAEAGIVITEQFRSQLRSAVPQLPDRLPLCGMGVGLDRLRRLTPYRAWRGEGEAELFSCGRLNPAKGHADLIRAVAMLRQDGLAVRCAIAGEDEAGGTGHRRELEALIRELNLEGSVELLGAVSERDVIDRLHRAHVFVLASLGEPFGVAVMESMAAGLPTVVTDAGGNPQLVVDGVDGVLFPVADPAALARAVGEVLHDPDLAESLAVAAAASAAARDLEPSSAQVLLELAVPSRTPHPDNHCDYPAPVVP